MRFREMDRDTLLCMICPMHRINDCCNGTRDYKCYDCAQLMGKWLDEYDKQIRADVIDEFAKKLIQTVTSMTTGFRVVGNIERIAKELKEQNNDNTGVIRLCKRKEYFEF